MPDICRRCGEFTAPPHRITCSPNRSVSVSSPKVVLITIDGFRWQELFAGADESLMNRQWGGRRLLGLGLLLVSISRAAGFVLCAFICVGAPLLVNLRLSDLILLTKGSISERWFYMHLKKEVSEKLPRIDTLDLLSQYCGYQNWRDFVRQQNEKQEQDAKLKVA